MVILWRRGSSEKLKQKFFVATIEEVFIKAGHYVQTETLKSAPLEGKE